MASLKKYKSANKIRGYAICGGAERFQIWIGKPSPSQANLLLSYISQLETSRKLGLQCDNPAVTTWLSNLDDKFYQKLLTADLVPERRQQKLSQLFDDILSRRDIKAGTRKNYVRLFARFTEFLGDKLVKDVTEADCLRFAESLDVKDYTKASYLRNLKHALADSEEIDKNPFDRINTRSPAPDHSRRRLIDRAVITSWCDNAQDTEMAAVIALGGLQGLRVRSEPAALRWENISFDGDTLTVPAVKTRSRIMPLFADTKRYLLNWHEECDKPTEGLVFPRLVLQDSLIARVRKLAGEDIPRVWVNLRSSAESHLVSEGFPIHMVANWIGHSAVVATKHYLQISPEAFDAAKKIGS